MTSLTAVEVLAQINTKPLGARPSRSMWVMQRPCSKYMSGQASRIHLQDCELCIMWPHGKRLCVHSGCVWLNSSSFAQLLRKVWIHPHALECLASTVYLVVLYHSGRTEGLLLWWLCFSDSFLQLPISHQWSSCQKLAFASWLSKLQFPAHIPYRETFLWHFPTYGLIWRLLYFISPLVGRGIACANSCCTVVLLSGLYTDLLLLGCR